ncbi:hypothetical protein B7486_62960 [cyanobacterium TDX16]|nr:hypothetical protein B7486_62960 [cyanobacterium TDX16]
MRQLSGQLQQLADEVEPMLEPLDSTAVTQPLIIAADGVTVPFRSSPGTTSSKIVWREVKVAILARLSKHLTRSGTTVTRVHQRRVVAVLGDISALQPRLQLEAFRQVSFTPARSFGLVMELEASGGCSRRVLLIVRLEFSTFITL